MSEFTEKVVHCQWGGSRRCGSFSGLLGADSAKLEDATCRACLQDSAWDQRVEATRKEQRVPLCIARRIELDADHATALMYAQWIEEDGDSQEIDRKRWIQQIRAYRVRYGGTLPQAKRAIVERAYDEAVYFDIMREARIAADRLFLDTPEFSIRRAQPVTRPAEAALADQIGVLRESLDEIGKWSALLGDAVKAAQLAVEALNGVAAPVSQGHAPVNAVADLNGPYVKANPYARHDMSWPGFGPYVRCDARVERPSGWFEPCGEPASSPVHG